MLGQNNLKKFMFFCVIFIFLPITLFAESGHNITHQMMLFVLQVGIILYAAKLGGTLFEKLKFPAVIGQLVIGIFIGPYLLGSISLPGFPEGLFPLPHASITSMPISPTLYGIATIASIILLFGAGLETDFRMFLKFSVTGIILGIGGVIFSFILGDMTAMYFLKTNFMNPQALFLGVMSTATSVGITSVILSEKHKMDSPEGVSIMSGAVIDDILGIILLTIVVGIAGAHSIGGDGSVDWHHVGSVALKAVSVFLTFSILGVIFAHQISTFLKIFKSVANFSILALGLALVLAAIFEHAGLAMIVGAYVMGLALSKTDLSYVVHDKLQTMQLFFVPVFFTVMGMLVNPFSMGHMTIIKFGLLYSLGAVLAKVVGCGLAARFLNFNWLGSLRIGLGMVPRGEVALIVAGIGLSRGVLKPEIFGVAVFMTLVTTLIAPPLLNLALGVERTGTTKEIKDEEKIITVYDFPSMEALTMVEYKVIESFRSEGFFIHLTDYKDRIYHILKDKIVISMTIFDNKKTSMEYESDKLDVPFIKTVMYETLLDLDKMISKLKDLKKPSHMRKELIAEGRSNKMIIKKFLNPHCILVNMESGSKKEVIEKLVDALYENGEIPDKDVTIESVMSREEAMSTGLTKGLAIPHAKIDGVKSMKLAFGFIPKGVDFDSIDKELCRLVILMVSPAGENVSHLQVMSNIISMYSNEKYRKSLLSCKSHVGVMDFLSS